MTAAKKAGQTSPTSFVILWRPEAEKERSDIPDAREREAIGSAEEKLKALGNRLPFPHSSQVKGSGGVRFRELRPRGGRSRWRPIYRQVNATTCVILAVGPEAEIDEQGFNAALTRAAERFSDLEV